MNSTIEINGRNVTTIQPSAVVYRSLIERENLSLEWIMKIG